MSMQGSSYGALLSKFSDLRARIFYLVVMLILYRFGSYIPLPGVDPVLVSLLINQQSSGMLGMFNVLTGGALSRMSIFALNIMPYITASIIMQLFSVMYKEIGQLSKDGGDGKRKLSLYTKYLTIMLAVVQGYGIALGLEAVSYNGEHVVHFPGYGFRFIATCTLVAGTVFVIWIADQISNKGVGNGGSVIIFSGIVSNFPSAVMFFLELGKNGNISIPVMFFIVFMLAFLIFGIVFVEKAQRRLKVQYPSRQIGKRLYAGDSTHLPLKINTAGVVPPIFASSVLLFPMTIAGFIFTPDSSIYRFIMANLSHGKLLYILLYVLLVFVFAFYYTSIVFNSTETADALRKNGAVVQNKRPGKDTAEYFDYVLSRLTMLGALYISFICVMPEWLIEYYSIPFYLGGTSLLIVVNVILDLFGQVQAHLLGAKYDTLMSKARIKR